MEEYNIINGAVSYKKGQSGFSRTSYDTMVFIPEFYYKIVYNSSQSKIYYYVANAPFTGFSKHPVLAAMLVATTRLPATTLSLARIR